MATNNLTSQTYKGIEKLQVNKLSLEKAEAALLSYYETEIKRHSSRQLQSMNKNKVGRPFLYSRILIEYAAIIFYLRDLSYRRLKEEIKLRVGIRISKSQLQERITKLLVTIDIENFLTNKILDIAMDATGFRPTNKGLWRIINHENGEIKNRNGYIKLLATIDINTKCFLSACIGDAQTADSVLFDYSFEELKGRRINKFYGDGSFDSFKVYRKCIQQKITPVIKPDKNAVVYYNKEGSPRELRSYYVYFIKKWGYKEWSKRFGYGKRWYNEIVFSKFKRLFGDVIRSKTEANVRQEFTIKIWIYNMLTAIQYGYNIFFAIFLYLKRWN